jgi:hypothetical protein
LRKKERCRCDKAASLHDGKALFRGLPVRASEQFRGDAAIESNGGIESRIVDRRKPRSPVFH